MFCIQKDLKNFNFVGLASLVSVMFLCGVVFVQSPLYIDHYKPISTEPLKLFELNSGFFKSFGLYYFLFFAYSVFLEVQKNTALPSRRRLTKVFVYPNMFEVVLTVAYSTVGYLSFREFTPENILDRTPIHSDEDFLMNMAKVMFGFVLFFYIPINFCPGRNALSQLIYKTPFKSLITHSVLSVLFLGSSTLIAIIFPKVINIISLVSGTVGITLGLLLPVKVYLTTHATLKIWKRYLLITYALIIFSLAFSSAILS